MMRKFVLVILSFACVLPVMAQDGISETFRTEMSDNRVGIEYEWSCTYDGKEFGGHGNVLYQDGGFRLISDAFEVYDNGTEFWTVDRVGREVVGELSSHQDVFSSPASLLPLFGFDAKVRDIRYSNNEDGDPSSIEVVLKDDTLVNIILTEISLMEKESTDVFNFDPSSLDSSYVVTDLR